MNWNISTWSLKTRRSSILKYGCHSNKVSIISNLISGRNCLRGSIVRKLKLLNRPLYPQRQKVYVASKANSDQQSMPSTSQPLILPPSLPPRLPQLILLQKLKLKPMKKAAPKNKKGSARKNLTRKSKQIASELADASALEALLFATSFPSPKSPHHNST